MNDPRRNHDKFVCQDALAPHHDEPVLSLKGSLLYCMNHFLVGKYEEQVPHFTHLSYNKKRDLSIDSNTSTKAAVRQNFIHWEEIPLKLKKREISLFYISALPQMLRHRCYFYSARSLRSETQRLVEELNQFQLQTVSFASSATSIRFDVLSMLWNEFTITTEYPGWIAFNLSNQGFFHWLEQLQIQENSGGASHTLFMAPCSLLFRQSSCSSTHRSDETDEYPKAHRPSVVANLSAEGSRSVRQIAQLNADASSVWQIQYAYARCCALIRHMSLSDARTPIGPSNSPNSPRAQWKKSVGQNKQSASGPAAGHSVFCDELDSLDAEQLAAPLRALLYELIELVDAMCWLPPQDVSQQDVSQSPQEVLPRKTKQYGNVCLKQARRLCQAFDGLHRQCLASATFVGGPQTSDLGSTPDSTLNSVGLHSRPITLKILSATRNVLRSLLRIYLRADAPEFL